ncbi:MAG: PQQ-binding-like beta-propeller repeat protein [Planctomycetota bacterium]|nr:PQQ-binding-like beta-propeller repeat protein [Planctomycetota bacterium]
MIRPSTGLTRFGKLAAAMLLLILGFQWVGPWVFRRGNEPVREPSQLVTDDEHEVALERPPEPPAVVGDEGPPLETPPQDGEGQSVSAAQAAAASKTGRSASRRFRWHEILEDQSAPADYRSICFAPLRTVSDRNPVEWVSDWLEDLGEGVAALTAVESDAGHHVALQGRVRLRPPLRSDVTLRLGFERLDQFTLRAWSGLNGVSLVYRSGDKGGWEGYLLQRAEGQSTPSLRQLVVRDEGRWLRREVSSGQPLALRYRAGHLLLSCGQTVLLQVPMQGEPRDVYMKGSAVVRGIDLLRTEGGPVAEADPADARRSLRLEALRWTGGQLAEVDPGGFTTLSAGQGGAVWATLPMVGLTEVVVELVDAHAGLGVFLGGRQGRPRCVVRLLPPGEDAAGAQFSHVAPTTAAQVVAISPGDKAAASQLQSPQWVRFLVGCGGVRGWVSSDGVRWLSLGRVPLASARLATFGFTVPAESTTKRISVRRVTSRLLPGLDMFTSLDEAVKGLKLDDLLQMKDWKFLIEQARPPAVAAEDWAAACALRTLRNDSTVPYATQLMGLVLDWVMASGLENRSRFQTLQTAMRLLDLSESHRLVAMIDRFHRLAEDWSRVQGAEPYRLVRQALLQLPVVTSGVFQVTRFEALRNELLYEMSAGTADRVLAVIQRAGFDRTAGTLQEKDWLAWSQSHARGQVMDQTTDEAAVRIPRDWEHPLVVDVHRETYNALAELHALVTDGALADASEWLANLDLQKLNGLAPDPEDRNLWVSLPLSLRLLCRQVPGLAQTLNERHGDLIRLRLEEAMNANQQSMVRRVAEQFPGTTGAVAGYRWLGDRALINGLFVAAETDYRQALADADETARPRLEACLRLTQALRGSAAGKPLKTAVQIGQMRLEPFELEDLVEELAGRVPRHSRQVAGELPAMSFSTSLEAVSRSRFEGPAGDSPQQQVTPDVTRLGVPWADRQLATVVEGQVLYVSNRFHVAAYDLRSGRRMWRNETLADKRPFRSRDWSLTPMRPCVAEQRLFVRLLYRPSPVLVCLDKSDGSLVWTRELPRDVWFVSDPLLKSRELWVLQTRPAGPHQMDLRLLVLDPRTGGVIRQHDLLRVRDLWKDVRYCALADLPEGIVASAAGVTFRLDASGALSWLRRHVLVPVRLEPGWVRQYLQPPLPVGDRVLLTQPGAAGVECVDLVSGRLHCRWVEPDLARWIGHVNECVIYQTEMGVGARSMRDGSLQWHRREGPWLSAACLEDAHLLVTSRQETGDPPNWFQPRLSCFDALSGRPIKAWLLPELADPDPRMGPLWRAGKAWWAFVGRGPNDPFRDLVELKPRVLEVPPQPQKSNPDGN